MSDSAVWDSLAFFLTRLKKMPCCDSAELRPGKGFCVSTRSSFASDNWAFFQAPLDGIAPIETAVSFFNAQNRPFIWPLFNDSDAALLNRFGLTEKGRLRAMSWDIDITHGAANNISFLHVNSPDLVLRWAETSWRGFGEEAPSPREFRDLVLACAADPCLKLVMASDCDRDIGSFIISFPPDRGDAGIYYFSVIPEFRRRGAATAMMIEAGLLALSSKKCRIILQATPDGALFYSHFGFNTLFEIPLFSLSDDVF